MQVFNGCVTKKFGIFALFRLSSQSVHLLEYYLFLEMGKKEVQDQKVNYERAEAVLKLLTKKSPLSVKQVGSSFFLFFTVQVQPYINTHTYSA